MTGRSKHSSGADDVAETLVEFLRAGNFLETACAAAGVRVERVRTWLRLGADPESEYAPFRVEILRAMAEAETTCVGMVRKQALNGDVKAAQWMLERRYPERWGVKVRHVVEEQLASAVQRVEALEGELGRDVIDAVLDALAGGTRGAEAEIEAQSDLH